MPSEKYSFVGANGDTLSGNLELPDLRPVAFAVFAHCFTCSKDFVASRSIANALAARGIAVLRFDFTGLGNSEGDFSNTNFSSNAQDLVLAAQSLAATHQMPSFMLGHSLGGAATLLAASKLIGIKAVATIGAPHDPAHLEHLFTGNLSEIESQGEAEVDLFGRPFTIRKQLIEDIRAQSKSNAIANLRLPLMVMHSPTDQIVGIENARKIFESARHPKSFVSLDHIDHLLSKRTDAEYVAGILSAWIMRYL